MYPVTSLKQAQEVLQADPQLSDCDSDSEDEDLLDVPTADAAGLSGKHSHSNAWTDTYMDPNGLPQYLQPLMEGLAEILTLHEREKLAVAIYEYKMYSAVVLLT